MNEYINGDIANNIYNLGKYIIIVQLSFRCLLRTMDLSRSDLWMLGNQW